jgi:hypothetical protein
MSGEWATFFMVIVFGALICRQLDMIAGYLKQLTEQNTSRDSL